ncbi:MAG: RDD family protein [Flammeovirgaceae bacterium]
MFEQYPSLLDRVKAVSIDTFVLVLFMVGASLSFSHFGEIPEAARISVILAILLYDPICTSSFGGTLGHLFVGIRVKRADDVERNLILSVAIIRFILKTGLGWVSLLTVTGNRKKQAIHDFAAHSVVVYKGEHLINV